VDTYKSRIQTEHHSVCFPRTTETPSDYCSLISRVRATNRAQQKTRPTIEMVLRGQGTTVVARNNKQSREHSQIQISYITKLSSQLLDCVSLRISRSYHKVWRNEKCSTQVDKLTNLDKSRRNCLIVKLHHDKLQQRNRNHGRLH
jgi:hypothetical protein